MQCERETGELVSCWTAKSENEFRFSRAHLSHSRKLNAFTCALERLDGGEIAGAGARGRPEESMAGSSVSRS